MNHSDETHRNQLVNVIVNINKEVKLIMKHIKQHLLTIFVIALVGGFAQIAQAECPPGKTLTEIINPTGKVIEICVSDAAIDKIGGPSDIVAPAACPCWTAESIDEFARVMTRPDCTIYSASHINLRDSVLPIHAFSTAYCTSSGVCPVADHCQYKDEMNSVFISEHLQTHNQFEACKEILLNSAMWSLNCSM
jgi:hypothetical protein